MENERDNEFMDKSDVDVNANADVPPDQQADMQPRPEKEIPPAAMRGTGVPPPAGRRPGESPRMPPVHEPSRSQPEAFTGPESQCAEATFARKFREWRAELDTQMIAFNQQEIVTANEGESAEDVRAQLRHQRYLEELREVTMRAKYLDRMTEGVLPQTSRSMDLMAEREELKEILGQVNLGQELQKLRMQVLQLREMQKQNIGLLSGTSHPRPPSVEEYHRITGEFREPARPRPIPEGYQEPVPPPPEPDGIVDLTKQIHGLLEELEMRLGPLCVGSPGSSVVTGPEGPPSSEYMAMLLNARMRIRDLLDRMVVI